MLTSVKYLPNSCGNIAYTVSELEENIVMNNPCLLMHYSTKKVFLSTPIEDEDGEKVALIFSEIDKLEESWVVYGTRFKRKEYILIQQVEEDVIMRIEIGEEIN